MVSDILGNFEIYKVDVNIILIKCLTLLLQKASISGAIWSDRWGRIILLAAPLGPSGVYTASNQLGQAKGGGGEGVLGFWYSF